MVEKTVLSNGLRIITEYMPESYSATVMIWIDAGPNFEQEKINGISHYIEHMLFKGTGKRSAKEIAQTIESSGGSINAFTDKESTCFYARVLKDEVPVAVDILFDMVLNSKLDNQDLELEKQVILEEIKMYEDTPDEVAQDVLVKSFWNDHPLGYPIAGTLESVKGITRDNIVKFIQNYYTPDNIIVSIAGNFDKDKAIEQVNSIISNIYAKSESRLEKKPSVTSEIISIEKEIEQAHICMGFRGTSILEEDRYSLAVIDTCMGGCMASRLFQEIREKRGLVYSINTYETLHRPDGIFGIYAATSPTHVQKVIELIMQEIQKLKNDGLTEEEFQKAKTQLKGSLLVGMESTKYRATRNARSELYFGKIFDTEEICESIDRVASEDIKRLSQYVFDTDYMGISIVGPEAYSKSEVSSIVR